MLDLFFPNRCIGCNRIISKKDMVCQICEAQIYFTNFSFDSNNAFAMKCRALFPVENAYSLFYYSENSIVQRGIHQLKYKHRQCIAKVFSSYLFQKMEKFPEDIDVVTIVPIHVRKYYERGYNQLYQFAIELSMHYHLPLDQELLSRKKNTKAQAKRARKERNDISNIFEVKKTRDNTHFLVIDDVFTTGATLSEIVWKLLVSGVNNRVSVLVFGFNAGV